MSITPVKRALHALVSSEKAQRRVIAMQHLGFDYAQLEALPEVLQVAGEAFGVELTLDSVNGDVVLAEHSFVLRVAPQVLNAFLEERPLIVISAPSANGSRADTAKQELLQQLHALALHQTNSSLPHATFAWAAASNETPDSSGFDSAFDSQLQADKLAAPEIDRDRARLLTLLRHGLLDPTAPPLVATYGHGASMRIDFASGQVLIDELADQRLRVMRDVPFIAAGGQPGPEAKQRELDLVVWDIGLAAGGFRLRQSPVNWWHAPLVAPPRASVGRYTCVPKHLDLARCLFAGPVSPAELRRRARVSVEDLRAFLQASLFLGLAYWAPLQHAE